MLGLRYTYREFGRCWCRGSCLVLRGHRHVSSPLAGESGNVSELLKMILPFTVLAMGTLKLQKVTR